MNDAHLLFAVLAIFLPSALIVVAIYDRIEDWWTRRK